MNHFVATWMKQIIILNGGSKCFLIQFRKSSMSKSDKPIRRGEYLIRINDVLKRIPVSRSSFYAGIRAGHYPQPVRVGKRTVAWREPEIDQMIADLKPSFILPQ